MSLCVLNDYCLLLIIKFLDLDDKIKLWDCNNQRLRKIIARTCEKIEYRKWISKNIHFLTSVSDVVKELELSCNQLCFARKNHLTFPEVETFSIHGRHDSDHDIQLQDFMFITAMMPAITKLTLDGPFENLTYLSSFENLIDLSLKCDSYDPNALDEIFSRLALRKISISSCNKNCERNPSLGLLISYPSDSDEIFECICKCKTLTSLTTTDCYDLTEDTTKMILSLPNLCQFSMYINERSLRCYNMLNEIGRLRGTDVFALSLNMYIFNLNVMKRNDFSDNIRMIIKKFTRLEILRLDLLYIGSEVISAALSCGHLKLLEINEYRSRSISISILSGPLSDLALDDLESYIYVQKNIKIKTTIKHPKFEVTIKPMIRSSAGHSMDASKYFPRLIRSDDYNANGFTVEVYPLEK